MTQKVLNDVGDDPFLIFFAFFAAPREIFSRKVAKNAEGRKANPRYFFYCVIRDKLTDSSVDAVVKTGTKHEVGQVI